MLFKDRIEAGKLLALKLQEEKFPLETIILAIPNGGVIIGKEIKNKFNFSLDIVVAKKIGAPKNKELAIGALNGEGNIYIDSLLAQKTGTDKNYIQQETIRLRNEIIAKENFFRNEKPKIDLKGKTLIITDDGVVTGETIKAAVKLVWQAEPNRVVVATPIISPEALNNILSIADEVIYLECPEIFVSLSDYYQNFAQVSDIEAKNILNS